MAERESYKISQKTYTPLPAKIEKQWLLVDAAGKTLGRLATKVAEILKGKNKPYYTPFLDCGDNVIVINTSKIKYTGKKVEQKLYRHHSGYPGGLREKTLSFIFKKDPTFPFKKAVKGMLPKNRLGRKLYRNLRVYADNNHKQISQKPVAIDI
jgi:large subunit ribosomal protein L13